MVPRRLPAGCAERLKDLATHGDDHPIYDTQLHTAIQLASITLSSGELVIYDPEKPEETKYIRSTKFSDTYDIR